ncbi:hypothetical protein Tco_1131125 [Tanacetum coccineum]
MTKNISEYMDVHVNDLPTREVVSPNILGKPIQKESMKKAIQEQLHELGGVNANYSYYNVSRKQVKTMKIQALNTSLRRRSTQKTTQLWKRFGLSQGLWDEAMLTACYLLNMVPSKRNRITPYELWTKKKSNLNYLRLGAVRQLKRFYSVPRPPNGTKDIGDSVVSEEVVQQLEPELIQSKRNMAPNNFGPEFQLYLIEGTRDEVSDQHSYCFNVEDNPKTFDEAMKSQDVAFWKEAINDEMDSIMGNNT